MKIKEILKAVIPVKIKNIIQKILFKLKISNKPKIISSHLSNEMLLKCMIAYNKYGGFCIPISSKHRPAVQKILKGDIYEPHTIEYMLSNCSDGDIVHAGTFFGDFLPALSSGIHNNAKVWAL